MSYEAYRLIHVTGAFLLFSALGAYCVIFRQEGGSPLRKGAGILHGLGLVILLVAGFGLLAKLGGGFPLWVVIKLVIWLLLGASIVLIRRMSQASGLLLWILPLLGAVAAYLALYKPGV